MTEMVETWINDRWPLLLPQHRHDRPEWYFWEAGRLASMWHHLGWLHPWHIDNADGDLATTVEPEREVVYDIGAEEGDFPALWSSWGCDVVLFEPNDRVWPNIKAIWEANKLRPPLACFEGFAGSKTEGAVLVASSDPGDPLSVAGWPGSAEGPVIGDHGFANLAERPDIARITIDDMATIVKPPTAITIDVEGAEYEVLHGAQSVMQRDRPKIWVSVHREFAAEMYGHEDVLADIKRMMARTGYDQGSFIAADHEEHWLWLPVEHPSAVAW